MADPLRTWTLLGPGGPYESPTPGTVGGHRRSRIYGRLDCPVALRTIARGGYVAHRVFFADEETAVAAGYRPCGVCMRAKYALWRNIQRPANGADARSSAPGHSAPDAKEEPDVPHADPVRMRTARGG